jgi:hypothetical protein
MQIKMKTAEYINRYGDKIIFKEINENQIQMLGGEYYRMGYEQDGTINFVDPSGGPFIQVGTELGKYFRDDQSRIVKSIESNEKIIFNI